MSKWFSDHLNTLIAFTISGLTLFSGLLGWQMGNISGNAAGAYSLAQRAELNAQKVISTNTMNAYENHRAFLEYKNYFDQYKLVALQLEEVQKADPVDEALVTQLSSQRDELQLLYLASLKLFPNRFINRAGEYQLEEQIGQMIASDQRKFDMNPDPHLKEGQRYEAQTQNLQIALIILAASLFCFAIVSTVQNLKPALMLVMTVLGYITAFAGLAMGIIYWN
jgi:hypothetical protein